MDDEADVGLVNAHAEGVGADQHLPVARQPALLHLGAQSPGPGRHGTSRPFAQRRQRVADQFGDFLALLAGGDVDQPAAAQSDQLRQGAGQPFQPLALALAPMDAQVQVGPVEAADQHLRVVHPQIGDDALLDAAGGRGRDGGERGAAQRRDDVLQGEIIGPEVVAPLRDAVRLVHDQAGDRGGAQGVHECLGAEAFGGDVQQADAPAAQISPAPSAARRATARS